MKKQKVTWKVISASSQMTCTHDKRLKRDADPQLCLPTKWRKPLYRSSIVTGGVLCIWNATWPKPLLTAWSLWSLICFEPCNTRPAICNQATNTSMRLSFHINPTDCVSIKLMCFGGTGRHTEAGRWGPVRLTGSAGMPFVTHRNYWAQLSTDWSWQGEKKKRIWPGKNRRVMGPCLALELSYRSSEKPLKNKSGLLIYPL